VPSQVYWAILRVVTISKIRMIMLANPSKTMAVSLINDEGFLVKDLGITR
jgi:hypothetical protein